MLEADNKPLRNPCVTSSLIALKPRQVLLAEQQQQQKGLKPGRTMTKKQQLQINDNSLKSEVKPSLVHCVLKYLHRNGFSKTLKRFLKEAHIENDNWKASSFDLEDIYSRYLENSRDADTNVKVHKEQDGTMEKDGSGLLAASEETISKKKKSKKSEKNDENAVATHSEVEKHAVVDSDKILVNNQVTAMHSSSKKKRGKKSDSFNKSEQVTDDPVCDLKLDESMKTTKDKKNKKKSKLASESTDDDEKQTNLLAGVIEKIPEAVEVLNGDSKRASDKTVKSKDKKEKLKLTTFLIEDGQETKNRMPSDSDAMDIRLDDCKTESKKEKRKKEALVSKKLYDNGLEVPEERKSMEKSRNGANKESKKRKFSACDDSENNPIEKLATGESKRRKTEGLEKAKVVEQQGKVNTVLEGGDNTGGEIKEENGHVSQNESQQNSFKHFDQSTKGDLMKNGVERSAEPKSARKQRNGSAEPKTVNAFQRVKVDEVKFADDRLQDNSYWAKDGADYGYGAKAQDVLGQVKGRDFRHEKTKKKRGSYRGGQIDFHSHSIKFNYSDNE